MNNKTAERIGLSVYRLKPTARAEVERRLFANAIPLAQGLEGLFAPIHVQRKPPRWLETVRPYLGDRRDIRLFGEAPAGLLLIQRAAQAFVISFGHAWQRLELFWLELDFGRRVVLNVVPPEKVIEVHTEQVFAKWHLSRERAPRAASVREFDLEHDRDLLAALEGESSEPIFGKVVRGGISLRLSVPFETISQVLDRAEQWFQSDAYQKKWPDVDNIVPVRDPTLMAALDELLDQDLQSGAAAPRAVLFSPAFRHGDLSSAEGFALGRYQAGYATLPYLLYSAWERHLGQAGKTPSLVEARATPVHLLDEAGDSFERRSLYECLGYELAKDGEQYILSSGLWYGATRDFVSSVNKAIDQIKDSPLALPAWNGTHSEGEYNASCCRTIGLLHFDANNVRFGGGQSKFEFCDFMHFKDRILFFAKIPTRSSGCSHLTEQVRRTVELFFGSDPAFRRKLKNTFQKAYPTTSRTWLDKRPLPGEWKLCLVSLGKDKKALPFFAKCGIRRLAKDLGQIGHPVFFTTV